MAVLVTGTAVTGSFSFETLGQSLREILGPAGSWILALGLLAAGFTSAVAAPLASAITMQSLYGKRRPEFWRTDSARYRITWMLVLATGMGFGMAGFKPVPAILLAQALNGLILPVIGVYLLLAVNNPMLMKEKVNRTPGNIIMVGVVFITILLGLISIVKSVISAMGWEVLHWGHLILPTAVLSVILILIAGYRALLLRKQIDHLHGRKDI
jgi:Mn2+/Fe2+ NRAMP family transporter